MKAHQVDLESKLPTTSLDDNIVPVEVSSLLDCHLRFSVRYISSAFWLGHLPYDDKKIGATTLDLSCRRPSQDHDFHFRSEVSSKASNLNQAQDILKRFFLQRVSFFSFAPWCTAGAWCQYRARYMYNLDSCSPCHTALQLFSSRNETDIYTTSQYAIVVLLLKRRTAFRLWK